MAGRPMRLLSVAASLAAVGAVAVLASAYYVEYSRIGQLAAATPQVPPGAGAAEGAEALVLPRDVNPATVAIIKNRQDVLLLDVRTPEEHASGTIPGALSVPLDQLSARTDEIPREGEVVLYCRTGRRSSQAASLLADAGFDNVHNMLGGVKAWNRAGYVCEREVRQ